MSIRSALGDRYGEAQTSLQMARVARARPALDTALGLATSAAEVAQELGEPRLTAQARLELGDIHAQSGELDAARVAWTAALEGYRAIGSDSEVHSIERRLGE